MARTDFASFFPVGASVRFESEMWPGKWEYGKVLAHWDRPGEHSGQMRIQAENGALVDFDWRYLDTDPHLSLVRLVK